jgi:hypothetical protein
MVMARLLHLTMATERLELVYSKAYRFGSPTSSHTPLTPKHSYVMTSRPDAVLPGMKRDENSQ